MAVHSRISLQKSNLEDYLNHWVMENRFVEHSISRTDTIDKAISLDPNFRNSNKITLQNWVFQFLKRNNMAIRTRTRVGEIKAV